MHQLNHHRVRTQIALCPIRGSGLTEGTLGAVTQQGMVRVITNRRANSNRFTSPFLNAFQTLGALHKLDALIEMGKT